MSKRNEETIFNWQQREEKEWKQMKKKWNKMHTNSNNETFKWQTFLPATTIISCKCRRAPFQRCNLIACEIYNFVRIMFRTTATTTKTTTATATWNNKKKKSEMKNAICCTLAHITKKKPANVLSAKCLNILKYFHSK